MIWCSPDDCDRDTQASFESCDAGWLNVPIDQIQETRPQGGAGRRLSRIVCNFQLRVRELAESDASLAQSDSPRPATRIIAKLRILDSDALCKTIWVKLSLGSRTASGFACIDALLEQSGQPGSCR